MNGLNDHAKWIEIATEGLSEESVQRIREDIQSHIESTEGDPGISSRSEDRSGSILFDLLGDPVAANKRYRKTYTTEHDVIWDQNVVREAYSEMRRMVRIRKRIRSKLFLGLVALVWVALFGFTLFNQEEPGAENVIYGLIGFPIILGIAIGLSFASEWWRRKSFLSGYRYKTAFAIWAGGILLVLGIYCLLSIPEIFWMLRTIGGFMVILIIEISKGIRMYERLKGNEPIRLDKD